MADATSITEEVISFSLADHCPEDIYLVDWMRIVEENTCEGVKENVIDSIVNNAIIYDYQ